jgi:hypothetical protein
MAQNRGLVAGFFEYGNELLSFAEESYFLTSEVMMNFPLLLHLELC